MNSIAPLALFAALISAASLNAAEAKPLTNAQIEAGTRLQVFLDRAEFGPGKIDGRSGEFTRKALALYRESRGEKPAPSATSESRKKEQTKGAPKQPTPDTAGLDLASVNPVFISYTVTDADLKNVGEVPDSVPAKAKLKSLPYQSAAEAIAEKFHCDIDFLAEINPGKTKEIKAGDQLKVPNVEPFELAEVKDLKPGSDIAANDLGDEKSGADSSKKEDTKSDDKSAPSSISVRIDTKTNMVSIFEKEKLIAAFPVTIGSNQNVSPIGDWKVTTIAKMPNFRWDEAMLNHGERSDNFHILPPGPNDPVGVMWIALNKKGIGLHGTSDPDSIGRSESHGCIRLANWDVVRVAGKVTKGVPVSIH